MTIMQAATNQNGPDDCPVREDFLARLVTGPGGECVDLTRDLPEETRARLALFCYRRNHLRRVGLLLAATCSKAALVRESGHAGELIHLQAQNLEATLSGDRYLSPRYMRRPVTLPG
ncbi:hypothetical protein [Roseibium aestuarii]|uniref:Uncharacterized protein n=1 Tax=Roseibium aestuarii TaxID=2600299 RepID=A0ABW4JTV0_9HYPH|nr:hypothetical protein [Roseibium aestuarii]